MRFFAIGIEHPLDVPIERPQHADTRVQERPATFPRMISAVSGRATLFEKL
jgi:hypothetical protein